jgi:hypothetical protein
MAITSNTYTGNGSNRLFTITFPYLNTTDIDVYLNGALQTVTTQYSFANATTVEFVTAPSNGATVLLNRSTNDTTLAATFFAGSSIRASDLNENFDQVLYIAQETNNNVANAVAGQIPDGTITNVKLATDSVTSSNIIDGTIVNADVNASAGITAGKLSFTQAGTGATARTVDSKLKDTVSIKDFGAVGDGVADDTTAITAALTYAIANNKILTGANGTYAVQGRVSITDATSTAFSIVDCTFKSIGENNNEYGLFITTVNAIVDLQNVIYDGIVDSKYATNKLQWFSQTNAQTGASFGLSIWPQDSLAAFAISIVAKNINCQHISMVNSHSCGFRFNCEYLTIDSFFAKNLTFTSAYTAASKGSNISNYFAENVGRNLPASFDVYNPSTSSWAYSTNQSAGYYAQGSFGLRIGGAGHINLNNVYVNNFYTTAIVLDTNSTSNISNIFIESNENINRTNQVHGAIFYELSQGGTANNVQIVYNQRYSDTTAATTCCMIYCYTGDSDCTFNNILLEDARTSSSDTLIKCVDNQDSSYVFSKLTVKNAKTSSFENKIAGILNYPAQQPGKVLVDGLAVSGNLDIDFRDFRHVFIRGITKNTADLVDVFVGDFQANFSNTTLISDSHITRVSGTGAAAGCQIDNCFINGSINVTNNALGEGTIDVHSSITDSTLNLTATSIFDGTGTKSTLRVANNTITSASNTLNLRTAGMLEFTNNILRYNGAANCVASSGLNIVKNLGTTALKGPAATAPVGYSLAGSASTIIGNNDTITFDWT